VVCRFVGRGLVHSISTKPLLIGPLHLHVLPAIVCQCWCNFKHRACCVNAVNLNANYNEPLDSMLDAAVLRAAQDGMQLNRAAVGISSAEVGEMCVDIAIISVNDAN